MNTTATKITEGPWTIRRSNDGSGDVGITAPGLRNVLAECFGALRHSGERAADEAMANATLIAAAPDMLSALKAVLAHKPDNADTIWERVEDAIAAAQVSP